MGFLCMKFKSSFDLPGKEKPPQIVCLKYVSHSEFDGLSKPLPQTSTNNISTKPIKIKPVAPKPEILSIFNIPPPPLTEFEPKQEAVQSVVPPKSILKETKSFEDSQVEEPSFKTTQEPNNSESPLAYSAKNELEINDNQVEVPPSEKEVTLLFAKEQEISVEQELEDVLASFPTEQEEVPSSFSTEQEEASASHASEQVEISNKKEEVLPSHTSEQVEILNKEEEEGILSSADSTAHNSPYPIRYAKKAIPNYKPKLNDESEISDYESEDEDLDVTDSNNNQDGYSSQAASIFFNGMEAEPTPQPKNLPKDDDEV